MKIDDTSKGPSASGADSRRSINLLGVRIDAITESQCVERILDTLESGGGGWVVTHNLDHMRRLFRDTSFAELCEEADLRVADGMPLVWASRLQGTPLPERVAGSSLIWSLTEGAASRGRSVFLLGGEGDTSVQAARALCDRFPKLRIAGTDPAPIGFDKDPIQFERLKQRLIEGHPDIVYVALGSPKQEQVIAELRSSLPHTWWMGVGISFSFVCGDVKRAPRWVQRIGLEWFHRMTQEPGRLWKRYLREGVPFAIRMLTVSAVRRFAGNPTPPSALPKQRV